MKKLLQLFSHFIPLFMLGALWFLFPVSFSADLTFPVLYGICFLVCPLLGLVLSSRFWRGLLGVLSMLAFGCGIPAAMHLGGTVAAQTVLAVGSVCLGILLVSVSLPKSSPEAALLALRGVRPGRARKVLQLRACYAFFFLRSGILAGFIAVWLLFISGQSAPSQLWSSAAVAACVGLLGYFLYLILGAPAPAALRSQPKKSRYVFISLLTFVLLITAVYVYIGSAYTAPDPALAAALRALQTLLTPALIALGAGLLAGLLLGLILSFCGVRFFHSLFRGLSLFPTAIFAAFLHLLLPQYAVALAIPLALMTASGVLESRLALRPYRHFPMPGRKKAITLPLFHFSTLALLPRLGMAALFSTVFSDITAGGTLLALPELTLMLAASVLVVILSVLYILCFLTKEVRRHA